MLLYLPPVLLLCLMSWNVFGLETNSITHEYAMEKKLRTHVGYLEDNSYFSLDLLRKFYLTPHHMLT